MPEAPQSPAEIHLAVKRRRRKPDADWLHDLVMRKTVTQGAINCIKAADQAGSHLGKEHLLAAILETPTFLRDVLERAGLDIGKARDLLDQLPGKSDGK